MKKLFKEQNISLYRISKDLNIPMMKLYRYANKKINIEKMPTKLVLDLAYYFHIEVNKFYNEMVEYLGDNNE